MKLAEKVSYRLSTLCVANRIDPSVGFREIRVFPMQISDR